jgi:hypothetical protein
VADDVATAEAVLREKGMIFEQTDVAVVKLGHRPGSLGRAARRRGEAQINIDYSYCGFEPGSALALLVFGVDKLTKAATLLPTNLLRWIARRTRAILLSLQGTLAASADLLRCPDWDPRYLLTICCCTPNPALWTNPPALQ